MDSGIICACCGHSISVETLPECDYCGYINVGTLDGAAIGQDDAINYRNGILKKLKNISVVTYQYKWDEKSMEYAQQSRKEIKLADGVQCDKTIVWSAQEFGQNPDSTEPLVLEVKYQYDGEVQQIRYPIKPVRCESFWNVGVEVNARLKMVFHLGDKKRIAQGGEIAFLDSEQPIQSAIKIHTQKNDHLLPPYWGPDRSAFTNSKPSAYAVFNSITDNAAVGDERVFVRIAEKGSGQKLVSKIELEAGKQYVVAIYYHNNASETVNDKQHNYIGIAKAVKVSTDFPDKLKAGEIGAVVGKIKAGNTNPPAVWCAASIQAKEDIMLRYMEGSAKIYNLGRKNGTDVSPDLFLPQGAFIGADELDGVIPGGNTYASGQVTYVIQTEAVKNPRAESEKKL